MVCLFGVGILQIEDTFEKWFSLVSANPSHSCGQIVLMLTFFKLLSQLLHLIF